MRGALLIFMCTSLFADERIGEASGASRGSSEAAVPPRMPELIDRAIAFVDATLELPPPVRERPKVKVRIEPAPGHTKFALKKEAAK